MMMMMMITYRSESVVGMIAQLKALGSYLFASVIIHSVN